MNYIQHLYDITGIYLNTHYYMKFIAVMIAIFMVDICWAKYFLHVAKHNPLSSASWGSFILVFGAFVTIEYVHDKTLIIPAFIGGFIGTYITVYRERSMARKAELKEKG